MRMRNDCTRVTGITHFTTGTRFSLTPRKVLARRMWADGTSGRARRMRKATVFHYLVRLKASYLPALRMPLIRPAFRPFPPPTPACRGQDAAEKETRYDLQHRNPRPPWNSYRAPA